MRMLSEPKPSFKVGPLFVDTYLREVRTGGAVLPITSTEFEVMAQLAERKGGVVLRRDFSPWNRDVEPGVRHPVDDVIKELRKKLPKEAVIEKAWGRGYRLGSTVPVTEVAGPSVNAAERLKAIALDRMNLFTLPSLMGSIKAYEEVLRQGPDADTYANLAISYINKGHTGFCLDLPQRTIHKARSILKEALDHYPRFSSAFALRGLTHAIFDYDWERADADLNEAFRLNADDEYAHIISAHLDIARGRFDEGIAHARHAAELDWRTPMSIFTVPWMLVLAGRAAEGLAECERALKDFDPFAVGHIICGYAWEAIGITAKAIEEYKRSIAIAEFPDAYGCLGHAYGIEGDAAKAMDSLDKLRQLRQSGYIAYLSGWYEALVYVGLGRKAEALGALERAFDQKCDWLMYLDVDPRWNPLRDEPRFRALANRVGLQTLP
jgi:tetratricopeptide (TPR) repeat protein